MCRNSEGGADVRATDSHCRGHMRLQRAADYMDTAYGRSNDFADAIAVTIIRGALERRGGAHDGTLDLVRTFPDPEDKLRIGSGEWATETDQRTTPLDLVKGLADYDMIVDADETVCRDDLGRLRRYIAWRP